MAMYCRRSMQEFIQASKDPLYDLFKSQTVNRRLFHKLMALNIYPSLDLKRNQIHLPVPPFSRPAARTALNAPSKVQPLAEQGDHYHAPPPSPVHVSGGKYRLSQVSWQSIPQSCAVSMTPTSSKLLTYIGPQSAAPANKKMKAPSFFHLEAQ